jgi:hypothetical protein
MCGRYRRTTKEEELARIYRIPIPTHTDYRGRHASLADQSAREQSEE